MRSIVCEDILQRNMFPKISYKDYEEQVEYYLIDIMNSYDTTPISEFSLIDKPIKKYEIFKLIYKHKNSYSIFLIETDLINCDDDINLKELYYSRNVASKICHILKRLNEDAIIGISELEVEFQDDINALNNEIDELRKLDTDEYNMDLFSYITLKDTSIFKDIEIIEKSRNDLLLENEQIKNKLSESEKMIRDLTEKLMVSLETIEKNRNKLMVREKSKSETFLNKIKKILH